jgi:hypothetical protein
MRFRVLTVVVAVALLLSVVPLMAHHAAQAQYDKDSQQEITGVMKRVQWEISGSGPGGYRRNGISARGVFPVGETYTALIALARDGSAGGYIMTWTLPNGAVLDFWHDYGAR